MKKCENWKRRILELFYCNPGLNRRALCIRNSVCELKEMLNSGFCRGGEHKKGKRR